MHSVHRVRDCLVPGTNTSVWQHVHARLQPAAAVHEIRDEDLQPPHASRVPPFVPVVARSSTVFGLIMQQQAPLPLLTALLIGLLRLMLTPDAQFSCLTMHESPAATAAAQQTPKICPDPGSCARVHLQMQPAIHN